MEYQYNRKTNTVEVACTRLEKLLCFCFRSERAIGTELIRDLAPHDPQARAAKEPRVEFIHPPRKLDRRGSAAQDTVSGDSPAVPPTRQETDLQRAFEDLLD